MPQIQVMDVRERKVAIFVGDDGEFYGELDGDRYVADSLANLRHKLLAAHKRKALTIDVPFDLLQNTGDDRDRWGDRRRGVKTTWRFRRGHVVTLDARSKEKVVAYEDEPEKRAGLGRYGRANDDDPARFDSRRRARFRPDGRGRPRRVPPSPGG